ncbi:MAG: phytanoyl-CoA dioxygenase family protein [Gammaproteobacteria bacterium]|nr:phytanoyl-CoA dioxygenase family protein [Gammaproteobacteria bacterium]
MLDAAMKQNFEETGYLLVREALSVNQLTALKSKFTEWVEDSRQHTEPFGETYDGRPRFDIEPGHNPAKPALRRVASPVDMSPAYYEAMKNNGALTLLTELLTPNIRFHHCKINSKLPGAATAVKYHQDFMFEPHTNADLATVLFFLDDVTLDNGPLEVVPGSHKGELHSLWHDGVFTGAVGSTVEKNAQAASIPCTGKAGDACIMHSRLLHGSAPNRSMGSRTLFICCYAAADALPLSPNPLPTKIAGEIVAGAETTEIRSEHFVVELPEVPTGASFFSQQQKVQ